MPPLRPSPDIPVLPLRPSPDYPGAAPVHHHGDVGAVLRAAADGYLPELGLLHADVIVAVNLAAFEVLRPDGGDS